MRRKSRSRRFRPRLKSRDLWSVANPGDTAHHGFSNTQRERKRWRCYRRRPSPVREGLRQVLEGLAEIPRSSRTAMPRTRSRRPSADLDLVCSTCRCRAWTDSPRWNDSAKRRPAFRGHHLREEEEADVRRAPPWERLATSPNRRRRTFARCPAARVAGACTCLRCWCARCGPGRWRWRRRRRSARLRVARRAHRRQTTCAAALQGQSNKTIARELDLSDKTVKGHITAIFRALGVVNRTQAAIEARKRGLLK